MWLEAESGGSEISLIKVSSLSLSCGLLFTLPCSLRGFYVVFTRRHHHRIVARCFPAFRFSHKDKQSFQQLRRVMCAITRFHVYVVLCSLRVPYNRYYFFPLVIWNARPAGKGQGQNKVHAILRARCIMHRAPQAFEKHVDWFAFAEVFELNRFRTRLNARIGSSVSDGGERIVLGFSTERKGTVPHFVF